MKLLASDLRKNTYEEVKTIMEDKKMRLLQLRQALKQDSLKDVHKYKVTKKDVARCLHVMTEKKREEMEEKYKNAKVVPKDLRPKLTRARRPALPSRLANRRMTSVIRRATKFPTQYFSYSEQ